MYNVYAHFPFCGVYHFYEHYGQQSVNIFHDNFGICGFVWCSGQLGSYIHKVNFVRFKWIIKEGV